MVLKAIQFFHKTCFGLLDPIGIELINLVSRNSPASHGLRVRTFWVTTRQMILQSRLAHFAILYSDGLIIIKGSAYWKPDHHQKYPFSNSDDNVGIQIMEERLCPQNKIFCQFVNESYAQKTSKSFSQDNENSACLQEETNQKYYNAFRQQFGKIRAGYLPIRVSMRIFNLN